MVAYTTIIRYAVDMFERCLYFNVNRLARRVNRIWDEAFKPFGLSPSHAYLLRLVLAEPGLTLKAIGEELHLEKSTVSRFVDAMVSKGLVVRAVSDSGDAREQKILPSATARKLHDSLEQAGDTLYQQMGEKLGKRALSQLVRELREVERRL